MTENTSKQPSPDGIVFAPHLKGKKFQDLTGNSYHYLTVLGYAGIPEGTKQGIWYARCECGVIKTFQACNLKNGSTKSCGCKKICRPSMPRGLYKSSEYHIWKGIVRRCLEPSDDSYPNYGGRGIKVCDRWIDSPETFFLDMGNRPSDKHSIDRIDVNGDYEPSNCRWATQTEQGRNTRFNRILEFNGVSKCVAEWEDALGFNRGTLKQRVVMGWSVERALTQPVQTKISSPSQTASTAQHA